MPRRRTAVTRSLLTLAGTFACAAACTLAPSSALAQASRANDRYALTVATPATIGLLWRISDRLVLHPELGGGYATSSLSGSSSSLSPSLSLRLYGAGTGATRTYVAPRLAAQLSWVEGTGNSDPTWSASLDVGAQHRPEGSSLMLFAQGGVETQWFERDNVLGGGTFSARQWRLRTVFGIAWYLGGAR